MRPRIVIAAAAAVMVACSQGPETGDGNRSPEARGLIAQVASYDLVSGEENRLIVGLLTEENRLVVGGDVGFSFTFLGDEESPSEGEPAGTATGEFLPLPGQEGTTFPDRPMIVSPAEARGVYRAEAVTFDRPGFYEVEVRADLGEEDVRTASAAFEVVAEPAYPAPGDRAPRTENLIIGSDAPPEAIDSRAGLEGKIPDPELHRTTIADAIRRGRPAVVVFATPVYCISQFCGPVTDMVAGLARDYRGVAEFIHVEIWRNFQEQIVNRGAAEWLLRRGDLTEPWVFLIGPDGRILARWDNVATREEIEPWLERLR
ncbi:MAG TPA: hypothetical protein VGS09_09655 [Actinomycetota bacterium]|nr:hypothetical protein [Actinomycetota bacterium]